MHNSKSEKIRVLIVDDSALYRKVISDILAEDPDVEVVGVAMDGEVALERCAIDKPHLITLDLEMPKMNGLQVLERLRYFEEAPATVVLSSHTCTGAQATAEALRSGAFDFVLKPQTGSVNESTNRMRERLNPILSLLKENLAMRAEAATQASGSFSAEELVPNLQPEKINEVGDQGQSHRSRGVEASPYDALAIGVSTGGPAALAQLLPRIPRHFALPIFVVQHMPPIFTAALAEDLDRNCELEVCEAENGQPVVAGKVYLAPGGKQMKVVRENRQTVINIENVPAECGNKPSVDYLFKSLATIYGEKTLAVVMTGMGEDGVEGVKLLRQHSATIIAQDEDSSSVYAMPKAIIENGFADRVVSLENMAAEIVNLVTSQTLISRM